MQSELPPQETEVLHSVRTFAAANPAFTEPGIRWVVFQHKDLLLAEKAIAYIGGKLVIFGNVLNAAAHLTNSLRGDAPVYVGPVALVVIALIIILLISIDRAIRVGRESDLPSPN